MLPEEEGLSVAKPPPPDPRLMANEIAQMMFQIPKQAVSPVIVVQTFVTCFWTKVDTVESTDKLDKVNFGKSVS
jgi:hypothetical protein